MKACTQWVTLTQVIRLVGEHMSGKVTLSPLQLTKPNLPLAEIAAILKQVNESNPFVANAQSVYLNRVQQCLSSRRNWDTPPLFLKPVCPPPPPPDPKGVTHSPACEGVGEPNFGRLKKKLNTLSTLWASTIIAATLNPTNYTYL